MLLPTPEIKISCNKCAWSGLREEAEYRLLGTNDHHGITTIHGVKVLCPQCGADLPDKCVLDSACTKEGSKST